MAYATDAELIIASREDPRAFRSFTTAGQRSCWATSTGGSSTLRSPPTSWPTPSRWPWKSAAGSAIRDGPEQPGCSASPTRS